MNWKSVTSNTPGTTAYQCRKPKAQAWISHKNGHIEAEAKSGWFNLGHSAAISSRDTTLSDQAVLGKLEDLINPPRFQNWQSVADQQAPGVTHYKGQTRHGKVDAYITRLNDEAHVTAHAGHFGVQIEGSFFAPAPSDQEILKRISRPV